MLSKIPDNIAINAFNPLTCQKGGVDIGVDVDVGVAVTPASSSANNERFKWLWRGTDGDRRTKWRALFNERTQSSRRKENI